MAFVLRNYWYLMLALSVGVLVLCVSILLPNISLLSTFLADSAISLTDKLYLVWSLLGALSTNFTPFSAITTVSTSFLVGVNVALIVYLYKRQKAQLSRNNIAISSLGVFFGMFGVGCAACGSLFLTALLSTFGGISLLTFLPLEGQEISIFGVCVLTYATYTLVQNSIKPIICKI